MAVEPVDALEPSSLVASLVKFEHSVVVEKRAVVGQMAAAVGFAFADCCIDLDLVIAEAVVASVVTVDFAIDLFAVDLGRPGFAVVVDMGQPLLVVLAVQYMDQSREVALAVL